MKNKRCLGSALLKMLLGLVIASALSFLPEKSFAGTEFINTAAVQSSVSLVPYAEYLTDPKGSLHMEEIFSPSHASAFLPLTDGPGLTYSGTVWLRFTLAPTSQPLPDGAIMLDLGKGVPKGSVLYAPKITDNAEQPSVWQGRKSDSNGLFKLPPANEITPVSIYVRVPGAPSLWFAPTLRTVENAEQGNGMVFLYFSMCALGVALAICMLRAFRDGGEWRLWTAVLAALILAQPLLDIPPMPAGKVPFSILLNIFIPSLSLVLLPHIARHLFNCYNENKNLDRAFIILSIIGGMLPVAALLPGTSWLIRILPLWPALAIFCGIFAIGAAKAKIPGSGRYILSCLLLTGFALLSLLGTTNAAPNSIFDSAPIWGGIIFSVLVGIMPINRQNTYAAETKPLISEDDGPVLHIDEMLDVGVALRPSLALASKLDQSEEDNEFLIQSLQDSSDKQKTANNQEYKAPLLLNETRLTNTDLSVYSDQNFDFESDNLPAQEEITTQTQEDSYNTALTSQDNYLSTPEQEAAYIQPEEQQATIQESLDELDPVKEPKPEALSNQLDNYASSVQSQEQDDLSQQQSSLPEVAINQDPAANLYPVEQPAPLTQRTEEQSTEPKTSSESTTAEVESIYTASIDEAPVAPILSETFNMPDEPAPALIPSETEEKAAEIGEITSANSNDAAQNHNEPIISEYLQEQLEPQASEQEALQGQMQPELEQRTTELQPEMALETTSEEPEYSYEKLSLTSHKQEAQPDLSTGPEPAKTSFIESGPAAKEQSSENKKEQPLPSNTMTARNGRAANVTHLNVVPAISESGSSKDMRKPAPTPQASPWAKAIAKEAAILDPSSLGKIEECLKVPLESLMHAAEELASCSLPPLARVQSEAIKKSGEVLAELVNTLTHAPVEPLEMLEVSPQENESVFDLHVILREAHDAVVNKAERRGLALSWFMPPHMPLLYKGNAAKLQNVLRLLLDSAIESTYRGSVQVAVRRVPDSTDPGHLVFSVTDTGQTSPSLRRSTTALMKAWEMVVAAGGALSLDSTPNQGTIVSFTLRLVVPGKQVDHLLPILAKSQEQSGTASADGRVLDLSAAQPLTILVADEQTTNRQLFSFFLNDLPYIVEETRAVEEAIELYAEAPVGLVVFDNSLTDLNLSNAIKNLHNIDASLNIPPVPVIALVQNHDDIPAAIEAGATTAIRKPLSRSKVRDAVGGLLPIPEEALEAMKTKPVPIAKAAKPETAKIDDKQYESINTNSLSNAELIDDNVGQSPSEPAIANSPKVSSGLKLSLDQDEPERIEYSQHNYEHPEQADDADHSEPSLAQRFDPSSIAAAAKRFIRIRKKTNPTAPLAEPDWPQASAVSEPRPVSNSCVTDCGTIEHDMDPEFAGIQAEAMRGPMHFSDGAEDFVSEPHPAQTNIAVQDEIKPATPVTPILQKNTYGEDIDPEIIHLIPGLLDSLDMALGDAYAGLEHRSFLAVSEACMRLAGTADAHGLRVLKGIANCVERAANANDMEAVNDLLAELDTSLQNNRKKLESIYDAHTKPSI